MATDFTAASIYETLKKKLQSLYNWAVEILYDSVYTRLLEAVSDIIEKFTYYVEFNVIQTSWKNATLKKSLVTRSFVLGYAPHRKIGSSGYIKISADSTFAAVGPSYYTGENVFIPKWTQFQNENGDAFVFNLEDKVYKTGTLIRNRFVNSALVSNLGGGKVGLPCTDHLFPAGTEIQVKGTSFYDGIYVVLPESTANLVVIYAPYVTEFLDGDEKISTGAANLKVREGQVKQFDYVASGTLKETIIIYNDSTDNDYLDCEIIDADGNTLFKVNLKKEEEIGSEPFLINDLENYYATVKNDSEFRFIKIQFGDGIYTKTLNNGDRVRITYAETKGASGAIQGPDVITAPTAALLDIQGNPAALHVTNDSPIADGADYEDIESIRGNARNLFQAGYRASSDLDWEAILNAYPAVHKSLAWTNYSLNNLEISPTQHIVYATAVTRDGSELTLAQQIDIVLNYLKSKKDITDVVLFQKLKIVNMKLLISAKVKSKSKEDIAAEIEAILLAKYDILQRGFGPEFNIYDSILSKDIMGSTSVVYHHTEIYHLEKSTAYPDIDANVAARDIVVSKTALMELDPKKQILIQPGTGQIWLRRKYLGSWLAPIKIGQDNGGGLITALNNYTLDPGSSINYGSNQFTYLVVDIGVNNKVPYGNPGGGFGVNGIYAIISTGGGYLIAGALGIIQKSEDSTAWTEKSKPSSWGNTTVRAGAKSNDIYILGGDSGKLMKSTDNGENWLELTGHSSFGTNSIRSMAFSSLLNRFVIVGDAGKIQTCNQLGASFAIQAGVGSDNLLGVAYFEGGSVYIAVGGVPATSPRIQTSSNGVTWANRTSAIAGLQCTAVAVNPTVAIIAMEDGDIQSSADGITWVDRVSALAGRINAACWAGAIFVAAGNDGGIQTSPDGQSWALQAGAWGAGQGDITSLVANDDGLIVATASNGRMQASQDGIAWVEVFSSRDFGVFNPTENDENGYELALAYKTKDGNGELLNDIRLPWFYNITDLEPEDIDYDFEY